MEMEIIEGTATISLETLDKLRKLSPWECEHCGKVFWFGRKVEKTYTAWKEDK